MKILFGIPPADGWVRAARNLGHEASVLDYHRAFDCFAATNPDVVFADMRYFPGRAARTPVSECLKKWDKAKFALLYRPGMEAHLPRDYDLFLCDELGHPDCNLRPAADCPPDFPGGKVRPELACDVAVVGDYKPEYDEWVLPLVGRARLKVFGHSRWPVPHHMGHLPAGEIPDLYRSANFVLDLEGSPSRVLAVWASGGCPLSVRDWGVTDVTGLAHCPYVEAADTIVEWTKHGRPDCVESVAAITRQRDTLTHRLEEILSCRST